MNGKVYVFDLAFYEASSLFAALVLVHEYEHLLDDQEKRGGREETTTHEQWQSELRSYKAELAVLQAMLDAGVISIEEYDELAGHIKIMIQVNEESLRTEPNEKLPNSERGNERKCGDECAKFGLNPFGRGINPYEGNLPPPDERRVASQPFR